MAKLRARSSGGACIRGRHQVIGRSGSLPGNHSQRRHGLVLRPDPGDRLWASRMARQCRTGLCYRPGFQARALSPIRRSANRPASRTSGRPWLFGCAYHAPLTGSALHSGKHFYRHHSYSLPTLHYGQRGRQNTRYNRTDVCRTATGTGSAQSRGGKLRCFDSGVSVASQRCVMVLETLQRAP